MAREIRPRNIYTDRLLKLIPTEIIGTYWALSMTIPEEKLKWGGLILMLILVAITPLYFKTRNVKDSRQIIISMGAFLVWVYSLKGFVVLWKIHEDWIAFMCLVIYSLIVPKIHELQSNNNKKKGQKNMDKGKRKEKKIMEKISKK